MGLFKKRSSSRNDASRAAVFQPFSMSRRLSNIAEEEELSIEGTDRKGNQRKNHTKGTPGKSKNTPNNNRHRFQKLVEWDYGTEDKEPYEPPKDFLTIQKTREDLFYEKGPEKSKVVKVSSSSLDDVLRSNSQRKQGENSSFKLFQFAADTASLSQSCSSDSSSVNSSSVSSSSLSLKRPLVDGDVPYKTLSSGSEKSNKPKKIPKLSTSRANGRSLFNNRGAAPSTNKAAPNLSQSSSGTSSQSGKKVPNTGSFEPFTQQADKDSQNVLSGNGQDVFFGSSDWPNDGAFREDEYSQTSDFTGTTSKTGKRSLQEWPTEVAFEETFPSQEPRIVFQTETPPLKLQQQNAPSSSVSTRAKNLVEKSQALIKENRALFPGSPEVESKQGTSPYRNVWSAPESPFEDGESPFKENEHTGPSFNEHNNVSRSKSTEKKMPPKAESKDRQARVLTERDSQLMPPPKDRMAPQRQKNSGPNVSFRFEFDDSQKERGQKGQSHRTKSVHTGTRDFPPPGHIKRNPQRVPFAASVGNLGAMPQASPSSFHLFTDKASFDDSLNKKESFASTIDSCESNSTASSASTFVDASPRGIRGSFPNHMAPSSSSLSSSTNSTNLLNEVDFYKPSHMRGSGRRPPTGIPPTTILGSMLFQGDQGSSGSRAAASTKTISPKRDNKSRGVPHDIHATEDAAISDVTGSTASDWMIQGNKLLNRYYHTDGASSNNKKHKMNRQVRKQQMQKLEDQQRAMVGMQRDRRMQAHKPRVNAFVSQFNDRNDPVVKLRRHQQEFQYPSRHLRSGFDNQDDDDTNSLFEA